MWIYVDSENNVTSESKVVFFQKRKGNNIWEKSNLSGHLRGLSSYTKANRLFPCLPRLALGKYPKGKDFNSVFRMALKIILYGLKG